MRQYALLQDKEQLARDLDKALAEDSLTALGLWRALEPGLEVLPCLLSQMLGFAINSSNPDKSRLAWEVLSQHKEDPELRNHLPHLIARYLVNDDDWNYRRIAELYSQLQYQEERAAFPALCRVSDSVDIQEISDDYLPL